MDNGYAVLISKCQLVKKKKSHFIPLPQSNKSLLIKTNEENLVEAGTSEHRRRLDELSAKGIQDSR